MITSSNQYIRPEYLTPLPTTLDAKKSPLALLAQTCSQIGADTSSNKLFQTADKSKSKPDKEKSDGAKPRYDLAHSGREKSRTPEDKSSNRRTPGGAKTPQINGRCSSNQSATSPRSSPGSVSERKTPGANSIDVVQEDAKQPSSRSEGSERKTPQSPSASKPMTSSITTSSSDPAIKDLPLGTFKPGSIPPSTTSFLGAYPPPGLPLGMDLMTSSLMSQHHAALKSSLPYLNYSRLKNPDLVPVCRDPYCTGCGLSSHLLGTTPKTSCPAGCTQCDHATSKAPSYVHHSPAAAAYAHAQLAALAAASHLPYVCNWISSDASYCGKRFSSSDELLSHLRTHTSVTSEASALSMLSAQGIPTHPLLHRTYPTPPLSPLATARYHPYSKPSLLPPTLSSSPLTSFPLGHPSLSPYLTPYSLYGPRLGAAPGMHP